MGRLLKKVFSRSTFVLLTIFALFILDVAVVLGLLYGSERLFVHLFPNSVSQIQVGMMAFLWLVLIGTVLNIISRNMVPEAKIPWVLCVVVLNIVGALIYAVFSTNRPRRRMRKLGELLDTRVKGLRGTEESCRNLGEWSQVSAAIYREGEGGVYGGTKTEFFPTGEQFFERLKEDLRRAKKYIFMEYFILERGIMWNDILDILLQKVREGVEVRILYDDIGCMGKINAWYARKLRRMGVNCRKFNPFVPVVTNVHNNRDHRKITVVDGKVGYTGGINFTDEYINAVQPFGHWKDSAIRLEGEGVREWIIAFLQMFCMAQKKEEDFEPYLAVEYDKFEGEGFVQPFDDGPMRSVGKNVYLNLINGAKKSVWITTPYLILDFCLREALLRAATRGVDVRIVTPHIPDKKITFSLTRSNYLTLVRGGVKIYEYLPGFVHAKQMLVDGEIAVVGTINLDYRSLLHHFENAVLLYRVRAIAEMQTDFEHTFTSSELQTEASAKKGLISRAVCHVIQMFAPLF